MIRPVDAKHFMSKAELAEEKRLAHERNAAGDIGPSTQSYHASPVVWVVLAWTAVGVPLAWGVYKTLINVGKFFQ
jgi:hypothetical protein